MADRFASDPVDPVKSWRLRSDTLVFHLLALSDEWLEELQMRNLQPTCPLHGSRRLDTLCPVCALVTCRNHRPKTRGGRE